MGVLTHLDLFKNAKKLIMSALNAAKLSSETVKKDMDLALSFAIHEYLATGRSQLVAVQLEDMLLIESPVNIPGTSTEYPNWKRKLTSNTSEIFSNREITEFCQRLNVARGNHTAVD